jgi:hypothetical protein
MAVTFCLPPRPGELCASLTFELPGDHTTQQLTARHRVTGVCLSLEGKVLIAIDITDPATARPVDVRFDVVPHGSAVAGQSRLAGSVDRDGQRLDVYGTYLGPVADENLVPALAMRSGVADLLAGVPGDHRRLAWRAPREVTEVRQ